METSPIKWAKEAWDRIPPYEYLEGENDQQSIEAFF